MRCTMRAHCSSCSRGSPRRTAGLAGGVRFGQSHFPSPTLSMRSVVVRSTAGTLYFLDPTQQSVPQMLVSVALILWGVVVIALLALLIDKWLERMCGA